MGGALTVGLVGAATQAAADQIAGVRRGALPRGHRRGVRTTSLCDGRGRRGSSLPRGGLPDRDRRRVARDGRARCPEWRSGLGGRVDTHATGLAAANGAPALTRWFYRQRMEAVLCADAASLGGAARSRVRRPLERARRVRRWWKQVRVEAPATRTTVTGYQAPKADEQTIRPDAKMLLVAGAGWTKKQGDGAVHAAEAEQLILGFLRRAQASLGSSKSLVDQSGEGEAGFELPDAHEPDRPDRARLRGTRRDSPPVVTARSRMWSAGVS